MEKVYSVPVSNKVDIHAARMHTRQVAREIGMDLITQARVSLTTSTLAHTLQMGDDKTGLEKIVIEAVEKAGEPQVQAGVRITFYTRPQRAPEVVRAEMKDLQPEDELEFLLLNSSQIRVTLVMWANHSLNYTSTRQ